ncbi:MAG: EamA family transporter [Acidimicrobiia bacterium]
MQSGQPTTDQSPLRGGTSHGPLAWLSLVAVYIFWGTTYLAIRVAVETLPPFLMAGVRYLIAGAVLYPFVRKSAPDRVDPPRTKQWKAAALIGLLLLVGGNGLVSWAEQTVPSGIAALMVGAIPIWFVSLDRIFGKAKVSWQAVVGIVVGFGGVAILVRPTATHSIDLFGAAALVLAPLFWAIGSLYSRSAPLPSNSLKATALEMLFGGLWLVALGGLVGEWSQLDVTAVSVRSLMGLLWLIGPGSLIGFAAYTYALMKLPTSTVGTYAYVNPVVAVFLGWLILSEEITLQTIAGGAVIVGAVALTVTGRRNA